MSQIVELYKIILVKIKNFIMYECQFWSCSSVEVRILQMTSSSSCGSQAYISCSLPDSEGLPLLSLSRCPSFSSFALALPATWTQHGSQTRWDVAARLSETFNSSHDDTKITIFKFEPFRYLVSRFLRLIMWQINTTAVHESVWEKVLFAPLIYWSDEWFNH